LMRNESNVERTENGEVTDPSRQSPIPISMVPNRETSRLGLPQDAATPQPDPKRRRLEVAAPPPSESEEEAAMIAAAENHPVAEQSLVPRDRIRGQERETMSEGVAAALAKLREVS
jgi:hypothetical protein